MLASLTAIGMSVSYAADYPLSWDHEWPDTDFSKHTVPYEDIMSGGPPKDGIPSIDAPQFKPVRGHDELSDNEPVIGLIIDGEAKAYPLRILTWHEIVNDEIAGIPVTVTFCPLCNSAIVFDRRLNGRVLDFGTTGKLRHSDLVMYDRQSQSWWQQFLGEAIIGKLSGQSLKKIPARLESWANFRDRAPHGQVLVPTNRTLRNYGRNPYVGYDTASFPFLYRGGLPDDIDPMVRVVAVGNHAWPLPLVRERGIIQRGHLFISWSTGQNSALDTGLISEGRDIGNIIVQHHRSGEVRDVVYDVTFAFAFHALRPTGTIHNK